MRAPASALLIEEMRAKFNRNTALLLEGVGQQEAFGFGVERAALHAAAVPGGADLDTAVGGVDIHVGGHAHRTATGGVDDGKRGHAALALQAQSAGDFGLHPVG